MVETARERISRQALISFATNYNSASEALMELIDNPIDYRGNRQLNIEIEVDKRNDRISIRDYGGEGMDLDGLRNWLNWGAGELHDVNDIGQFHVGGKLAAMYLARKMQITCRRAGDSRIWHFSDDNWGTREEFVDAEIREIERTSPSTWISELDPDTGFVQVMLSGLQQHGFDTDALRNRITDTYEHLIEQEDCLIWVNQVPLSTYTLPWLETIPFREIEPAEVYPQVFIDGYIGALERRRLPAGQSERVQPGLRTTFNGRKISDGETFGINLGGKGTHQRLFGTIEISGGSFRPNQNKTGWDIDSEPWGKIADHVLPVMREVLADLGDLSSGTSKDPETRKRKRHALSFMMQWLNEGAELVEARRIQEQARLSRMQPKEWVRMVVRRTLDDEDPDVVE